MRILGVDPGLTRCGVGVIDVSDARRITHVDALVLRTPKDAPIQERLMELQGQIDRVLQTYKPDQVAVERVFSQLNVKSAMATAQAGAIAMVCAGQAGCSTATYTPTEVKAAVTGYGRADKQQVTMMVMKLLHLQIAPSPADAADALALALCHYMRSSTPMARAIASAKSGRI